MSINLALGRQRTENPCSRPVKQNRSAMGSIEEGLEGDRRYADMSCLHTHASPLYPPPQVLKKRNYNMCVCLKTNVCSL